MNDFLGASLPEILTHTLIRQRMLGAGPDGEDRMADPEPDITCLIDGSSRRFVTRNGKEVRADFEILIDINQEMDVGDILLNGEDQFGVKIFTEVKVISVDTVRHPQHGVVSKAVYVQTGV